LNPKVPKACSCCDCFSTVHAYPSEQLGRVHHRQGVTLIHLNGSTSKHQLCEECLDHFGPEQIPELWRRCCLLYAQSLKDTDEDRENGRQFAHNPPIGILGRWKR